MAMQTEHVARDGRRSACPLAEKIWQNPLLGGVCLLTKGVLIRVRRRMWKGCRTLPPTSKDRRPLQTPYLKTGFSPHCSGEGAKEILGAVRLDDPICGGRTLGSYVSISLTWICGVMLV